MAVIDTISAQVGPVAGALGSNRPIRADKTAALVTSMAHGKYTEAGINSVTFAACEQGTGVAPGTALGTTAFFVLYNPAGSNKWLALGKISVGYISGTLGAGTLYHCVNNTVGQTAPSGGTALTAVCCMIGNTTVPTGVARVGATVVAPTAYRPYASLNAMVATTATNPIDLWEDLDGEILLAPGTSYQMQAVAAAGTSPKMTIGLTWEEITIA